MTIPAPDYPPIEEGRLLYPENDEVQRSFQRSAAGASIALFLTADPSDVAPADCVDVTGAALPTPFVVDNYSRIPPFYGPATVTHLYVEIDGGERTMIVSKLEPRVVALEAAVAADSGGGSGAGSGGATTQALQAEVARAEAAEANLSSSAAALSIAIDTEATRAQGQEALAAKKSANLFDVADKGASRANLAIPVLTPAAAASTVNVASLTGLPVVDGYQTAAGDLVLLTAQTTASQDGLWAVGTPWSRPTEFAHAAIVKGRSVRILNGAVNGGTDWTLRAPTNGIVVDTDAQTWTELTVNLTGYVQVDGGGHIPMGVLPAITMNTVWPGVTSQAAMLALAGAEPGDVAVRTDINANFMLGALPASTLSNWHQLADVSGLVSAEQTRALAAESAEQTRAQTAEAALSSAISAIPSGWVPTLAAVGHVQHPLTGCFHPESWGALGDGSTDDTTAIQGALDAAVAAGGVCQFRNGATYKITAALRVGPALSTVTVGSGGPFTTGTRTVPISALGQALPVGAYVCFQTSLGSPTGNLQLTSAAAAGATSVTGTVTGSSIQTGDTGQPLIIREGYKVLGKNVTFLQATTNTPVFSFTAEYHRRFEFDTFNYSWATAQTAATPKGVGMLFLSATNLNNGWYNCRLNARNINGYRGIANTDDPTSSTHQFAQGAWPYTSTVWGVTCDELYSEGTASGSVLCLVAGGTRADGNVAPNVGMPNNLFRKIYAQGASATEPIVQLADMSNVAIGGMEVNQFNRTSLSTTNGVELYIASSNGVDIGIIRSEAPVYKAAGQAVWQFVDARGRVGAAELQNYTVNVGAGNTMYFFRNAGGNNSKIAVGRVHYTQRTLTSGSIEGYIGTGTNTEVLLQEPWYDQDNTGMTIVDSSSTSQVKQNLSA